MPASPEARGDGAVLVTGASAGLGAAFAGARTPRARGAAEVLASRMFLDYAEDIQSGTLDPGRVESGLVLKLPRRDPMKQIEAFAQSTPAAFLRALPPQEAAAYPSSSWSSSTSPSQSSSMALQSSRAPG